METPQTRYARTGDGIYIAYQAFGPGPITLVVVHPWLSNIEVYWEWPGFARLMSGLADRARVIHFDKRGTGLSDRVTALPDMETRMDDIRVVMDAADAERAALFGWGDGGALAALFAATHPGRTLALAMYGGGARMARAPDYPWGVSEQEELDGQARTEEIWGDESRIEEWIDLNSGNVGSIRDDPAFGRFMAKFARHAGTPGTATAITRMWFATDVRDVLPTIQVPTAVLYRVGTSSDLGQNGEADRDEARYLAERIQGASLIELHGEEWPVYLGDTEEVVEAIHRFLAPISEEEAEFDRVLATVLFTDIVESTKTAADLGDTSWRDLVERHHRTVRAVIGRYHGHEIDTAGDGFFASFDGPARAVRAAQAIVATVEPLGIQVRAGVHTGEVETIDGKVGGIAVNIGARVVSLAAPSEVLVSQTVKDLVAGSGLTFEDAGEHELKGIPDRWRIYRVVNERS